MERTSYLLRSMPMCVLSSSRMSYRSPCLDELIHVDGSLDGVIGCPLVLIQVTRLKCGGFIFTCCTKHTLTDAQGLLQFLNAMTEMVQGLDTPNIKPIWDCELLTARSPPVITHNHPEYKEIMICNEPTMIPPMSFFFGPEEISI